MTDNVLGSNGVGFEQHSDQPSQRLRLENRRLRREIEQLLQRCHAAESTIETLLGLLNAHGMDCAHLCEPRLAGPVSHQRMAEAVNERIGGDYPISTYEIQQSLPLGSLPCTEFTLYDAEVRHGLEPLASARDPMLQTLTNGCLQPINFAREVHSLDYEPNTLHIESLDDEAVISEPLAESPQNCDVDGSNIASRSFEHAVWEAESWKDPHRFASQPGNKSESHLHFDVAQPRLPREPHYMPNLNAGFRTSDAKGVLDEYILMLGRFLDQAAATTKLTSSLCQRLSSRAVQWVVREAWPEAEQFWKLTASMQGFYQAEMFRNFPSAKTYGALHPAYHPTKLQLSVPHAAIIDWLPWPDLRDQVILWQDQIDVDLVCRTAIENVVAHRKSSVEKSSSSLPPSAEKRQLDMKAISFRVLDLCLLDQQSQCGTRTAKTTGLTYKPRSAAVRALEKAYELEYDEFHTQRLHPRFFEQYPALYCQSAVSVFDVREVAGLSVSDFDVGRPRCMSHAATENLARLFQDELQCSNVNV